jgi:hypothetical protein
LCDLRDAEVVTFLSKYSLPGVCMALQRLKIKRKQGRVHVHSPDPFYLIKMRWIERAWELAKLHPDQVSLLYGDELSFYKRPTLAGGGSYYPRGRGRGEEPTFEQVAGYNTRYRVGAAMDAITGRVVWVDDKVVGVQALCLLLAEVRRCYGTERTIFLVWDNRHVHYQEKVAATATEMGIGLLWLPTYAPWTNPIEKMWRWLKQEHIHNHQLAAEFDTLKERVRQFLGRFADGSKASEDLLRYVGLSPDAAIT